MPPEDRQINNEDHRRQYQTRHHGNETRGRRETDEFEHGAAVHDGAVDRDALLHMESEAQVGDGPSVARVTVALAAGASLEHAARLASRAAAVTVGRVGTSAIRLVDLVE